MNMRHHQSRAPKVLVVTKMWPTRQTRFRNGFLKREVEAVRQQGVECEVLVIQDTGAGPRSYLDAALAVRQQIRSGDYDLVHAHYGLTAMACLYQPRPLVVTLHGSDIYGAVDERGRNTAKGRLERAISRWVAWRADAVVTVSKRMAALIPWAKPIVVPVGIDTELFRPDARDQARRTLDLDCSTPYIIFAANPRNPVKRHWLAEQAVSLLKSDLPRAQLVSVFGEPLDRMPLWMNAADVLLITSVREGGPLVHREAMACNLPVVSVDVGDVAEHMTEVDQSCIVADDPHAVAAALKAMIARGSRSNGRTVAERTSLSTSAQALSHIYRAVCELRAPASSKGVVSAGFGLQEGPNPTQQLDKCTADRWQYLHYGGDLDDPGVATHEWASVTARCAHEMAEQARRKI